MRIPRVYVGLALETGISTPLPPDRSHYLRNVLRMRVDDPVRLFNGDGAEYSGVISAIDRRQVSVLLHERQAVHSESPLWSQLGLALSKGERMDYAIQKCTELGINLITPLDTARSEVRLKGERVARRLQHWRQVAVSAAEQCGRCQVPEIAEPSALQPWLDSCGADCRLIMDQRQSEVLPEDRRVASLAILTGPEGGFTDSEIAAARNAGFRGIALGPRALRAESAPVATLAIGQWLWGDWRN